MRLIDADALIKYIPAEEVVSKMAIANAPTIDPVKHGKWILSENQSEEEVANDNYQYICSCCGKADLHAKSQEVPYCWWCGARMDEEEDL